MMEEKILQTIKESLPEQTANEMKAFIELANTHKHALEDRTKHLNEALKIISQLETELKSCRQVNEKHWSELTKWEEREKGLIKRELAVEKAEIKQELILMKKERDCAIQVSEKIFHLTEVAFKNPVVKKTVLENKRIPQVVKTSADMYDAQLGCNKIVENEYVSTSEVDNKTVETEETI